MSVGNGRFGLLFELTDDAVAEIEMVDHVPIVRTVNPAFVETFGYDREEIVGASLNEYIVPQYRRDDAATFDRRTAEGKANWASVTRRTAEGLRDFRYRGVPFEHDGRRRGLAIYTDVTDRRRRQRHHEVLHRVLRHNLRNDLAQITLSAEALADAIDDHALAGHVRRIRRAADDLDELSTAAGRVKDVLGDASTDRSTVDLAGTLRDVIDRYSGTDADLSVRTDLPEQLPVRGDHRLFDAFDALVENAVEHGSTAARSNAHGEPPTSTAATGSVATGGTDLPTVRVAVRLDDGVAETRIEDEGPGIPSFVRAAIFDDRPISQLSHSSGLGLWLAKWLVEGFGGRLEYERRGGRTTVTVRLPRV